MATALKRGQWLRAAIMGINTGIISTASLLIGAGAVNQDLKTMILTWATLLLTGALGTGGGEFVSIHAQYDIELSHLLRENMTQEELEARTRALPSPSQAAAASVVSYVVGATLPILVAAFIPTYSARVCVVVAAVSVSLAGFGWVAAVLGGSTLKLWSVLRLVGGGFVGMGVGFVVARVAAMIRSTAV